MYEWKLVWKCTQASNMYYSHCTIPRKSIQSFRKFAVSITCNFLPHLKIKSAPLSEVASALSLTKPNSCKWRPRWQLLPLPYIFFRWSTAPRLFRDASLRSDVTLEILPRFTVPFLGYQAKLVQICPFCSMILCGHVLQNKLDSE